MITRHFAFILVIVVIFSSAAFSQGRILVDTHETEKLVREWNFAHNARSVESFNNVYAGQLLFYTKKMSRVNAIAAKEDTFRKSPELSQAINSPLAWKAYSSGVIKCEFEREITENKRTRIIDAYLLLSYDSGRYKIVGESDTQTDRKLRYKLNLGEPISFVQPSDSLQTDSASTTSAGSRFTSSADINAMIAYVTSNEEFPVRRGDAFILIGMLVVGALLIVAADAARNRSSAGNKSRKNRTTENDFERYKAQTDFQKFVTTLFDPLYFQFSRSKNQITDSFPSVLLYSFRNKDREAKFAVQTIFLEDDSQAVFDVLPISMKAALRDFSKRSGLSLYVILGVGGTPEDPVQVYLIPLEAIEPTLQYDAIQPYRKHGMFFYQTDTGRVV
jgi:hypothetical protein